MAFRPHWRSTQACIGSTMLALLYGFDFGHFLHHVESSFSLWYIHTRRDRERERGERERREKREEREGERDREIEREREEKNIKYIHIIHTHIYTVYHNSTMDASVEIEVPQMMRHFGDLVVRKYMPKEVRQLNRAHGVLHGAEKQNH